SANLYKANLSRVNLSKTDLCGCYLGRANLSGARACFLASEIPRWSPLKKGDFEYGSPLF
ncbi:MAG: pentapeptide repeat-containing protein, partial [Moorea sp. SIO4G2]|nr:pentapeptide repeat-containing protein [Moorena sp. SIO4G2]